MKQIRPVFFLSISLLFVGCVFCGPQAELTIILHLPTSPTGSPQIDSIFALNTLSSGGQLVPKSFPLNGLEFPISLRADSTTYVFTYRDSKKSPDTLTLFYARDFRFKGDCGFVVDAHKPANGKEFHTTFTKVTVQYGTYVAPNSWEIGAEDTATGIVVDIIL